MAQIPFEALGIPERHRLALQPDAPKKIKLAIARGVVPDIPVRVYLGIWYCLLADPDPEVQDSARKSLTEGVPEQELIGCIGNLTHPKVLEVLAEFRRVYDQELMGHILEVAHANDRTAELIAEVAAGDLVERLVANRERLLISPSMYPLLAQNAAVDEDQLRRIRDFMRLNRCLPEGVGDDGELDPSLLASPSGPSGPSAEKVEKRRMEAEVEAALMGLPSPATNDYVAEKLNLDMFDLSTVNNDDLVGFEFNFEDDRMDFGFDLTKEPGQQSRDEQLEKRITVKAMIAALSPGKRIKLAYLGNKEVRSALVRDRNKSVSTAVVKSGRLSETEVHAIAINKNLASEVFRELVRNKEYMRKYQVKVALCNNPKTPIGSAVRFVNQLQKRDLEMLARNKNIGGAVSTLAKRKVSALRKAMSGGKK